MRDKQLAEQAAQLQASVQMLLKAGLTPQAIASTLHMAEEEVRRLM